MTRLRTPTRIRAAAAAVTILCIAGPDAIRAQPELFQFIISVGDADGRPVVDLTPDEIVMTENGVSSEIVRIEPHRVPVTITIAVDNGPHSREALGHYRSGLLGLINALPPEVEVTLITTAPQPRAVVRPTTDRAVLRRGVTQFAPQEESPRFTDTIVEFARRLEQATVGETAARVVSLPVLIMVSTTAQEATSYEAPAIGRALAFLQARKAKVYVAMLSTLSADSAFDINANRQGLIGQPAVTLTGGRYEALAASSRIATLLPEWGAEMASIHRKHYNQLLVTVQRQAGLRGPLQDPRIGLTRPGLTGQVSLDGLP